MSKTKGDAAIVFDSLKKSLDDVTLLVKFGVEIVLNLEIDFIGSANGSSMLLKVGANLFARVRLVGEDFLLFEVNSFKQL